MNRLLKHFAYDSPILIMWYILNGIIKKISFKVKRFKYHNHIIDKSDILISNKYQIIYIRNPKVANRNFCNAIIELDPSAYYKRVDKSVFKSEYKFFFKFSFVRNPWQRVYSAYNNKICYPEKIAVIGFFIAYSKLYYKMPFYQFVDFLLSEEGKDQYTDTHWTSQHQILTYKNKPVCNFIGKLETLSRDLAKIEAIVNIKLKLGQTDERDYKGKRGYLKHYTKELIQKIHQRYEIDCLKYNYSVEREYAYLTNERQNEGY